MQKNINDLLVKYPLADYPYHSRIHPLPSFSTDQCSVFIKREDELGSLSMGSKMRKYLSLLPFLCSSQREVAIIGSPFSNNILGLCLLLKETKVPFTLFLQGNPDSPIEGNFFFTLLTLYPHQVIWVSKQMSEEQIKAHYEETLQKSFIWVPIGSSCQESLPGALTLPWDIFKNQQHKGLCFQHIFIDAGTGFNAAALVMGLGYLHMEAKVHIVQVAGKNEDFPIMLHRCQRFFKELYGKTTPLSEFEILRPTKARSFGSISRENIDFIREMAQSEGILLDPIYNAKLFSTAQKTIREKNLSGDILIIHSGGTLSLSGFTSYFSTDLTTLSR
ncbi:MAG: pyridoxal-phosphate dependent enzyme [Chlamydiae bacterium]|nr:pyridoxal-phosphate dependent enzyme [Chlamydiota bacterium]